MIHKKLIFTFSFKVWEQAGFYPSEPVFVPSPNAMEEDDGVILSVVITPNTVSRFLPFLIQVGGSVLTSPKCDLFQDRSTFLLVLDAKTFEELGRAMVPVNIPYGFHGTFNATT